MIEMSKSLKYFILITALSIFVLIFIGKMPIPGVIDIPPAMHQFYGNVSYPNGSLMNGNVYALVSGVVKANVTTLNGKYGYNPLFIVEDVPDNSLIEFYINKVKVANYTFTNLELTELNLIYSLCGDGYCSSQEFCSSCSQDCGVCSSGGDGGGGGGGGGNINKTKNNKNVINEVTGNNETKTSENNQENKTTNKPGITGRIIGAGESIGKFNFFSVLVVIVVILALILLIIKKMYNR